MQALIALVVARIEVAGRILQPVAGVDPGAVRVRRAQALHDRVGSHDVRVGVGIEEALIDRQDGVQHHRHLVRQGAEDARERLFHLRRRAEEQVVGADMEEDQPGLVHPPVVAQPRGYPACRVARDRQLDRTVRERTSVEGGKLAVADKEDGPGLDGIGPALGLATTGLEGAVELDPARAQAQLPYDQARPLRLPEESNGRDMDAYQVERHAGHDKRPMCKVERPGGLQGGGAGHGAGRAGRHSRAQGHAVLLRRPESAVPKRERRHYEERIC